MSTVLLLEGSDLSASQSVTTIAEAAGFTVYHLASQEQLPQYLTQVSETPVIVLAGYEGERSVELQRLRRAAPWASIVLVGAGDVTRTEGAPLVRSVSLNEPAALGEVLREAAQEGIERRRTRRTLDAFNRRLQRILHPVRPHTASLTLSAHYFSGLVHYAPDAILVVDRSGKVIFCNRATERLFELPQARITGAPLSQICRDAEAIEGLLQQTLAGVAAVASEVMCVLLRGAVLHLELTVAPVEDEQGAVVGASLIARDIGERRKVEFERLRLFEEVQAARLQAERSEQEYRLLAEAMPQIVWTGTAEGQMAYFNSRFTEYTGITDWSRSWSEALVDQRVFLESWRQARERGSAFEAECRLRAHSGTMRWFLARAVPHRTGTEPVRWLGTFTDIDDRRQAESYARFVSEASALLASSLDLDLTLTHLANLCVPFLADWCTVGLVPEEGRLQVLATRHSDPAREREVQALAQLRVDQPSAMEQAAASGRGQLVPVVTDAMIQEAAVTPERYAILQRLGLRSYMVVPFMLRGRVLGVLSFVSAESRRQFGEREFEVAGELAQRAAYAVDNARSYREAQRQSEARGRLSDELRRSEARYRSLTVASAEIVWRTDSAGHMQDMQAWCRWTGQTPAQAVSDWWYRVHPGDRERLQRDWAEVQHDPRALRWECRLGTADGHYRHVLLQLVPVAVSLGTAPEWMGTVVDVDDRRRAEEALAAEKERLLVTLRSIGEGVVTTDIEGRCRLLNPVAERLTGWRQEEALGQGLSTSFRVFTRDQHAPMDQTFLHALQGQQVQVTQPLLLEDRAGLQRLVQASAAPIMDGARIVGMVLVFRDVTLQTRVEEDFIKHQKLESIGVLAGGIAHDFNNVLTAILGNVSLARLYAEPGSRVTQILGEAERAFWRARDLTHQLLTFAKGGAPVRQTRDIRPVLVESAKLGLAGSNVRSILELAADLWPVDFDEGQISQVVNNLVINAKQAMPEGGSVCLRAVNLSLAQDNEVSLPAGRYVRISVEDEGIGIPKEHLLNIFDPYFTTKQGGSGLGLATAYSIIRRHDGFVRVTSEPGCGARFDVYLPASGHSLAAPAEPLSAVSAGGGRILVMDDEAMVREVAAQLLAHLGYRVEAAANGEQALTLYAEALAAGDRFDAVLLDLTVIGGMGGRECIGHLRALDPGVRAVASSGYSSAGSLADYRQQGFDQVIEKPYDLAVLARTMALAVSAGDTTDAL